MRLESVKKVIYDGSEDRFVESINPAGPKSGLVSRLGMEDA